MDEQYIKDLERRIAELRARIPPHSIPPKMLEEIDELEDKLEKVRKEIE